MSNGNGLFVGLEGDAIVIRLPIDILVWVTENGSEHEEWTDSGEYVNSKVVDRDVFVRDVLDELEREEEDGTTPVHLLIDRAISLAIDNGSLGIDD